MHESCDGPAGVRGFGVHGQGGDEPGDANRDWLICRVLNLGPYCDCDGRPLLEGEVPRKQWRSGVPFELRPCPYPGARAVAKPARPMNVAAMRRVLTTLPESFGLFLYIRRQYLERLCRKDLRFIDLWRAGTLTTSLPEFLTCRKVDAVPDGELPPYVADAYKFSAGVTALMMVLAFREAAPGQRGSMPAMTVESLLKKADRMLVSEKEVCAPPPTLIAEALRAYVTGKVGMKTVEPVIESLIKDFGEFLAFASVNMDLKLTLWLLTTMRECVVKNLLARVKSNERRGKKGRAARAPVLKSLTAALTGTVAPWRLDGLADAMRSRILKSGRDKQFHLLHRMAEKLVSQPGEERTRLLEKLDRAAGTVRESGAVNLRQSPAAPTCLDERFRSPSPSPR